MKDFDVLKNHRQHASISQEEDSAGPGQKSLNPPNGIKVKANESESSDKSTSSPFQLKAASDSHPKEKSHFDQPLGQN